MPSVQRHRTPTGTGTSENEVARHNVYDELGNLTPHSTVGSVVVFHDLGQGFIVPVGSRQRTSLVRLLRK